MLFDLLEPDQATDFDLPTIDLSTTDFRTMSGSGLARFDRRSYEERYAELGFGLGTVPRRQRRDDAWWETPVGMLAAIGGLLVLLWITST